MFRTRLTHSLEVAQIARTAARALSLNEDLTEAIALAHDLGHTPFGHAGQTSLNACMKVFGGFEHNRQSLRVVDTLEQRYPEFSGLNLLYETREGILKHCKLEHARELGDLGQRFIAGTQPSLEAQLANVADEIAYNHHDIDDGLRANLLSLEQLLELPLFHDLYDAAERQWRDVEPKTLCHSVIREMLNYFVVDLIESTAARLDEAGALNLEQIRAQTAPMVDFSSPVRAQHRDLKRLLRRDLYHHERVLNNTRRARIVVGDLFQAFFEDPQLMPSEHANGSMRDDAQRAQIIADYVAGMTDRFAIAEHNRMFQVQQFSVA